MTVDRFPAKKTLKKKPPIPPPICDTGLAVTRLAAHPKFVSMVFYAKYNVRNIYNNHVCIKV
jgi:hypothetical protein